jgi:hypothetical protein
MYERLVYVQFILPKQRLLWQRILSQGVLHHDLDTLEFRDRIRLCWLPDDYPASLNMMFSFTSPQPSVVMEECRILKQRVFIGAKEIGIVEPEDAPMIPEHAQLVLHPTTAEVTMIALQHAKFHAA